MTRTTDSKFETWELEGCRASVLQDSVTVLFSLILPETEPNKRMLFHIKQKSEVRVPLGQDLDIKHSRVTG